MKKYDKKTVDAIDNLINYTIYPDLRIYYLMNTLSDTKEELLLGDHLNKNYVFNWFVSNKFTVALEAERLFKNTFVKVSNVMEKLKSEGVYEPPAIVFTFHGNW